jgi:exonuclease SbcD
VMVAGNHDTPRTAETGCILGLFKSARNHVVEGEAQWIPRRRARPGDSRGSRHGQGKPRLEPDPTAKYNILLLHGEIEGVLPKYGRELDRSPMEITSKSWVREVGLRRARTLSRLPSIAPNAFYPGLARLHEHQSVGRAGRRARWDRREGNHRARSRHRKTHKFHSLPPARPLGRSRSAVRRGTLAGLARRSDSRCARQLRRRHRRQDRAARRARRSAPHPARARSQGAARVQAKGAALSSRYAAARDRAPGEGPGAPGRRASLADTVRDKLRSRPLTENIDREALVELGLHYLREADLVAGPTGEEAVA